VAAREQVSGVAIFRFWKSSSDDQSGRQHRMNGGLWEQLQEKRGTVVFFLKNCFQKTLD
jgi:hypothetical protein